MFLRATVEKLKKAQGGVKLDIFRRYFCLIMGGGSEEAEREKEKGNVEYKRGNYR